MRHGLSYPLVSVVIPTHNRKEKLARLIKSILESDYPKNKLEVIVVDDASMYGTYEYIKKLFPHVRVIRNEEEKLLAESRNIGIKASRGKYIFVVDDDNVVGKNTIRELVEFMEKHPEVGVAGPIMYFLEDPKRIWCAGVKRSYWTTVTHFIGFNTVNNNKSLRNPYETEDLPNAFMVRREVFEKVGFFDSRLFPIHYDEGDFCNRVRRAGYRVVVVPSAKIWHDIPLPERSRTSTLRLKSPLRAYYAARNRILFHWKWSRNTLQRVVSLIASLTVIAYYIVLILKDTTIGGKGEVIKSIIRGVIDGLRLIREVTRFEPLR
jgi:hypothetical protein